MTTDPSGAPAIDPKKANLALALCFAGFLLTFWAWALMGPLGATYKEDLGLSSFQQSLVVALPVVVGSLGRIPVGALTDRLGGRTMFPLIAALTIIPTLFVGFVDSSLIVLLIGGFFLGIGGTSFAVGVPTVNSWFPPNRRGTAIGIFGAGMGGTAVAAFTTLRLRDAFGDQAPFILVAVLLAIYAVTARMLLQNSPAWAPAQGNWVVKAARTLARPVTLKLSWMYAMGFGGFVAFSVYLPTYLHNFYELEIEDAALRTAIFVVVAVACRPLGGALADRFDGGWVLVISYVVTGLMAAAASERMPLIGIDDGSFYPVGTAVFLVMAASLGVASGAVFALVAELVEPSSVGSVTGIVGAVGGLGGFVPPLLLGYFWTADSNYRTGLLLLFALSVITAALTWLWFLRTSRSASTATERTPA
ncbi:nitrate/nitrite transporter [uncultured Dietzia sp.]|uniref:MFS transporter n=1 Tax=uncultured Dietzia sp. TaxID=395519 RepID=UPI0025D17C60|nr:MFS transporter [uncultured Dietzia sp.]